MAFTALHRGRQRAAWGLPAPVVLWWHWRWSASSPCFSSHSQPALPMLQLGQKRTCSPCPGASSHCIHLRTAQRPWWLLILCNEDTYSPSWSCSAHRSLLHAWRHPCCKKVSDPHETLLPPQDLAACWTGFPGSICLGISSGKCCSFVWPLVAGELGLSLLSAVG